MRQNLPDLTLEPMPESVSVDTERCPSRKCGKPLDAESLFRRRCTECGCVLRGNQFKRKYPKPPTDDPDVQRQLAQRRDQIITDKGGRDRLSVMRLGDIGRYVVLEAFVTSWETYFMKSSPISKQGRVRSGYREGYLASLDRLMKLGSLIGVERVARDIDITDMNLHDYIAQTKSNPTTKGAQDE